MKLSGDPNAPVTYINLRKDVTAKCAGCDRSRKHKRIDKQKTGQHRMREFGRVEITQKALTTALKMDC